jgi:septal ring factor EnvC (AmiA/AmiB activator)
MIFSIGNHIWKDERRTMKKLLLVLAILGLIFLAIKFVCAQEVTTEVTAENTIKETTVTIKEKSLTDLQAELANYTKDLVFYEEQLVILTGLIEGKKDDIANLNIWIGQIEQNRQEILEEVK